MSTTGSGSPCGACKFLRRKCTSDCIFAPHFCSEQGPARFAAIHKIFGASNVAKLLSRVPVSDRSEAVITIAYEAQARLRDPVYGCVSHIFALQQQVAGLQAQLMQVKAQVAQNLVSLENQWAGPRVSVASDVPNLPSYDINCFSTQSSLESVGRINDATGLLNIKNSREEFCSHVPCSKIRASQSDDLGELQELAFRMMKD